MVRKDSHSQLSIQRKDDKSDSDARDYYDRSCKEYLLANCMDKAAECLVKTAHVVEKKNINMAAGYMLRACNLFVVEFGDAVQRRISTARTSPWTPSTTR